MGPRSAVLVLSACMMAAPGAQVLPQPRPGPAQQQAERRPDCGTLALRAYYESGAYLRNVREALHRARQVVEALPAGSERVAMVLDIDDTSLSMYPVLSQWNFCVSSAALQEYFLAGQAPAIEPTLELFRMGRQRHIAVFFVSSRGQAVLEATAANLRAQGFDGFEEIFLRPADWRGDAASFKADARRRIQNQGYRILLNVGDQAADLEGGLAEHAVLVPNPFYTAR